MTKSYTEIYAESILGVSQTLKEFDEYKAQLTQILDGIAPKFYSIGIIFFDDQPRNTFEIKCRRYAISFRTLDGEIFGKKNPIVMLNIDFDNLSKLADSSDQKTFLYGLIKNREGARYLELQCWEANPDTRPYKYHQVAEKQRILQDNNRELENIHWNGSRISLLEEEVKLLPDNLQDMISHMNERIFISLYSEKTGHYKYNARGIAHSFFNQLWNP